MTGTPEKFDSIDIIRMASQYRLYAAMSFALSTLLVT